MPTPPTAVHPAPTGPAGERYTIRRKIFVLFGASFEIFDDQRQLVGFCRQKAFKLKEDIQIWTDSSMSGELMRIRARSIIDFAATYDLLLPDGIVLGSIRRKGLSSIIRDQWLVFDRDGREIAQVREDSTGMALVRRFLPLGNVLFPSVYHLVDSSGRELAVYRQHFNVFVFRLGITIKAEDDRLDELLILATGCLLAAIEGRQGGDGGIMLGD